ncbi:MAG: pyridoxamine 5'-phosphate oxidase [Bacteroidota bacterium]
MSPDPIALFQDWFESAHHVGLPEPAAAALATVGADGQPSVRMVLLRGLDERGFVFFTNLTSRKGKELLRPGVPTLASLCFYWPPLARQVRVEGPAERVADSEADAYWATRPRGHQVAAYASPQSEPLPGGRKELEAAFADWDRKLPPKNVPRPDYWSGFRVIPKTVEFWEGRENRLHRRVLYTRAGNGWTETTLAP